jgi:5-methylcytosine-specific restriction protein A
VGQAFLHSSNRAWMPMSIPDTITADHVRQALEALDRGESHPFGEPTRYLLHYQGRCYPPKAVIGLAARFATGKALGQADCSGVSHSQVLLLSGSGLRVAQLHRSRRAD